MAHLFPPFLLQSLARPAWPLLHPVCLPGSVLQTWTEKENEPKLCSGQHTSSCLGLLDCSRLLARPKIDCIKNRLSRQLPLRSPHLHGLLSQGDLILISDQSHFAFLQYEIVAEPEGLLRWDPERRLYGLLLL